ncbi:hypothetical protein OIO90_001667 [Microbotryomycetes sp. JL221]|nr:hypothetical protein OIO90_001667 [Microbotryomycetes sp. JL221]
MSFPEIKNKQGPIILVAHVYAKSSQEENCLKHLLAIRDYSVSDKEPGTLTYRVTRSEENEGLFVVFEEYKNEQSVKDHANADGFQNLLKSGSVEKAEIKFYNEQ